MKLVDQDGNAVEVTENLAAFVQQYALMWEEAHPGVEPKGWHPIPENVGSEDVKLFIVFSEPT